MISLVNSNPVSLYPQKNLKDILELIISQKETEKFLTDMPVNPRIDITPEINDHIHKVCTIAKDRRSYM